MTDEQVQYAVKLSKTLIGLIQADKDKVMKREELENLATDILFWQTSFVKVKIEAEQAYRLRIRDIMEKENASFAGAENKAMCEEVYALHKKVKHIYELAEEKIRLLKIILGSSY